MVDDSEGWGQMFSCPLYTALYDAIYRIDGGTGFFLMYLVDVSETGRFGMYSYCCDVPNWLDRTLEILAGQCGETE